MINEYFCNNKWMISKLIRKQIIELAELSLDRIEFEHNWVSKSELK